LDNAPEQSDGAEGGGVRTKFVIGVTISIVGLLLALFVPSRLYSKQFETKFNRTKFYCGRDIEVSTVDNGAGLVVYFTEYNVEGEVGERQVELFYSGSALYSDNYQAKTGEKAEYDLELKLHDFRNGVGGICY
jgi:hypothetical protein